MQHFIKTVRAVFEDIRTDEQTTEMGDYIGPPRVNPGSKIRMVKVTSVICDLLGELWPLTESNSKKYLLVLIWLFQYPLLSMATHLSFHCKFLRGADMKKIIKVG